MADLPQEHITRRAFLIKLRNVGVGASVIAVIGGILAYFWPRNLRDIPAEPVPAGTLGDLEEKGFLALSYGVYPAIVVQTDQGPAAFSRVCTHFSCTVEYQREAGRFHCPCHEAVYNGEDGSVISGPPTAPLRRFELFVEGDSIYLGVRRPEAGG